MFSENFPNDVIQIQIPTLEISKLFDIFKFEYRQLRYWDKLSCINVVIHLTVLWEISFEPLSSIITPGQCRFVNSLSDYSGSTGPGPPMVPPPFL